MFPSVLSRGCFANYAIHRARRGRARRDWAARDMAKPHNLAICPWNMQWDRGVPDGEDPIFLLFRAITLVSLPIHRLGQR